MAEYWSGTGAGTLYKNEFSLGTGAGTGTGTGAGTGPGTGPGTGRHRAALPTPLATAAGSPFYCGIYGGGGADSRVTLGRRSFLGVKGYGR